MKKKIITLLIISVTEFLCYSEHLLSVILPSPNASPLNYHAFGIKLNIKAIQNPAVTFTNIIIDY